MEITQLDGLDPQLYILIGPLVMNPKILKANNNYPFKTTEHYQWYIGIENNEVVGFIPVEKKASGFVINNYYIKEDSRDVLRFLLEHIPTTHGLSAVALTKHEKHFADCRFNTEHRWTNYIKMTYDINKHE